MTTTIPANLAANDVLPESWVDDARQGLIDLRDRPYLVVGLFGEAADGFRKQYDVRSATLAATDSAHAVLPIPSNFAAVSRAVIVGIADATETIQFDVDVNYGANGQAYNTHTGSAANETLSATDQQYWEYDFSSLISSLAANDHLAIIFGSDTSDLHPMYALIEYTIA